MDVSQFTVPQPGFGGAVGTMGYPQFAPQGISSGGLGGPIGGSLGGGVGSPFGTPAAGQQFGQTWGTIGGGLQPFGGDPITAACMQHAQLAQHYAQLALQHQAQVVQLVQQVQLARQHAQITQQPGPFAPQGLLGTPFGQAGRLPFFGVDPLTAAYLQQAQLAQQQAQLAQQPGLGAQIGGGAGQMGRYSPYQAGPIAGMPQQVM